MYAVIEASGRQYRVAPGDNIRVNRLDAEHGATVEFDGLIAVSNAEGKLLTGNDISNAKVVATVNGEGRGDKIIVFKFKRKKQYKRTDGHRQDYTELTINDVVV